MSQALISFAVVIKWMQGENKQILQQILGATAILLLTVSSLCGEDYKNVLLNIDK